MWVHFDVREASGVPLEMHFQVTFGGETISANVALERSFSGVRPNVNLQCRITAEHFTAVAAPVLEQLIFLAFVRRAVAIAAESKLIG